MVIVDYMYEPKTVVNGCVYPYLKKKLISSDNNLTNNRSKNRSKAIFIMEPKALSRGFG